MRYVLVIPTVTWVFLQLFLCGFCEDPTSWLIVNETAQKFSEIWLVLFAVRLEIKYLFLGFGNTFRSDGREPVILEHNNSVGRIFFQVAYELIDKGFVLSSISESITDQKFLFINNFGLIIIINFGKDWELSQVVLMTELHLPETVNKTEFLWWIDFQKAFYILSGVGTLGVVEKNKNLFVSGNYVAKVVESDLHNTGLGLSQ